MNIDFLSLIKIASETRERPKLNLAPRTKPIQPIVVPKQEEESVPVEELVKETKPVRTTADIFGAAKPVDTTAREREIEERLAKTNAEKAAKAAEESNAEAKATWGRRNGVCFIFIKSISFFFFSISQ